jgi:hypothetical protein
VSHACSYALVASVASKSDVNRWSKQATIGIIRWIQAVRCYREQLSDPPPLVYFTGCVFLTNSQKIKTGLALIQQMIILGAILYHL